MNNSPGFQGGFGAAMGFAQGNGRDQSMAGALGGASGSVMLHALSKKLSKSKRPIVQIAHGIGEFAIPMLGVEGAIRLAQRMRKQGLDSATGAPAPNAGTVGPAPTLDRKARQKERVEVTKNAAWKQGAMTAMVKTLKKSPKKVGADLVGSKSKSPRASTKMGLGTEELLPSIKASEISSTPNFQPPKPQRI